MEYFRSLEIVCRQNASRLGDIMTEQQLDPYVFGAPPFVTDWQSCLECLHQLHHDEDALMFDNDDGQKIILRSMSEPSEDQMMFDLVVGYDEDDDPNGDMIRPLKNEYGAIRDEDGYVFQTISMSTSATEEKDLEEMVTGINDMAMLRVCECGEYFVKNNRQMCYRCTLQRDAIQPLEHVEHCIICQDPILTRRGLKRMMCCKICVHKNCYNRFKRESPKRECPVCREEATIPTNETETNAETNTETNDTTQLASQASNVVTALVVSSPHSGD